MTGYVGPVGVVSNEPCPDCGRGVPLQGRQCAWCGAPTDAPAVKLARAQRPELLRRSASVRAKVGDPAADAVEAQSARTRAVVNTNARFAADWLDGRAVFVPYDAQVRAGLRAPAALDDDRNRQAAEALLYGSAAGTVVYAALTLGGDGLWSYGEVALCLADEAVRRRSVVLQENSFDLIERLKVTVRRPLPPGYLGGWGDRGQVVLAKLGEALPSPCGDDTFAQALLNTTGDRATDRFVEVHIDGAVVGSTVTHYTFAPTHPKVEEDRYFRDRLAQVAKARGVSSGPIS